MKVARRVRRAAWGNGPRAIPAPRPRPTQPENAVVVCIDEKTQTQALDRTAPTLPMPRMPFATDTHVDAAPSTWPNSSRHELQTPPDV